MAAFHVTYTAEGKIWKDVTQILAESAGLTGVRVPMNGYGTFDRLCTEVREWMETDAAQGEYMVTNMIDGSFRAGFMMVYFTHDATAFAFKLRFG